MTFALLIGFGYFNISFDDLAFTQPAPPFREAFADESFNILEKYYFNPIVISAFLALPNTVDLPPPDTAQYFETKYSQPIQLEQGIATIAMPQTVWVKETQLMFQLGSWTPLAWQDFYYKIEVPNFPDDDFKPNFLSEFNIIPTAEATIITTQSGSEGILFEGNTAQATCGPSAAFGGIGTDAVLNRASSSTSPCIVSILLLKPVPPHELGPFITEAGLGLRKVSGQINHVCGLVRNDGIPSFFGGTQSASEAASNATGNPFEGGNLNCNQVFVGRQGLRTGIGTLGTDLGNRLTAGVNPDGSDIDDGYPMFYVWNGYPNRAGVNRFFTITSGSMFEHYTVNIPVNNTDGIWQFKEHSKYDSGLMTDCNLNRVGDVLRLDSGTLDSHQGQCIMFKVFNKTAVGTPDVSADVIATGTGSSEMRVFVDVKDGIYDMETAYGTTASEIPMLPTSTNQWTENQLEDDLGTGTNHRFGIVEVDSPFTGTIEVSPAYSLGSEDFFTVFVGIQDNSTDGSVTLDISNIKVGTSEYDFNQPDVRFYEHTITTVNSNELLPELDVGFIDGNFTVGAGVTAPILPTPPGLVTNVNATIGSSIILDWTHDGINTTGYRIYRTSTETPDEILKFNTGILGTTTRTSIGSTSFDPTFVIERFLPASTIVWTGEIISRVKTAFNVPTVGTAQNGELRAGIKSDGFFPTATNTANIANSTTSYFNNTISTLAVNPSFTTLNFDFIGDDLKNITSAQNVDFGVGFTWGDDGVATRIGGISINEGDSLTGGSGEQRYLFSGTWLASGGRDLRMEIYTVNQTKLFAPAIPFISDTGSLDTNFTDSSTLVGESYFFRIVPLNGLIEGNTIEIVNATEPFIPVVPSGLTATPFSTSQIDLTWQVTPPNDGYRIQNSTDDIVFANLVNITGVANAFFSHTGLGINTTHFYKIAGLVGTTNSSFSASVSATTFDSLPLNQTINDNVNVTDTVVTTFNPNAIPLPPTGLDATADGVNVSLDWDAQGTADSFNVFRNGSSIATNVTLSQFTDLSVAIAEFISYTVQAVNVNGTSGNSTASIVLTNDVPSSVTGAGAMPINGVAVLVEWDDPVADRGVGSPSTGLTVEYLVFRSDLTLGDPFVFVATVPEGIDFLNDTTVIGGHSFTYQILSSNEIGNATANSTATPPVMVDNALVIRALEGDGIDDLNLDASITIFNNTFTTTLQSNAQGRVFLFNASGAYNFTILYTAQNIDFLVNKTLTGVTGVILTEDTVLNVPTNVFKVDCASNGPAKDFKILVNSTSDVHFISNFTTPVCDIDDKVSWQVQYDGLGTGGSSVLFDHSGLSDESVDLDAAGGGFAPGGVGQFLTLSSQQIESVTFFDLVSGPLITTTVQVRIYSNVTDNGKFTDGVLEDTSDNLVLSTKQNQTFNQQFNFTTPPTLTGSDIWIGMIGLTPEDGILTVPGFTTSQSNQSGAAMSIGEDPEGILFDVKRFYTPIGLGITNNSTDMLDVAMKVNLVGGGAGTSNFTTTMATQVLSLGDFGNNAKNFVVNGTMLNTTFVSPVITSEDIVVSTNSSDVLLVFEELFLQEAPFVPPIGGPPSPPPSQGAGGGGVPSLDITTQLQFFEDLFGFSLFSKIHQLQVGQTQDGTIDITWNSPSPITITGIQVGDQFITWIGFPKTPFVIEGNDRISTGKIPYRIMPPNNLCDEVTGQTANCVDRILYEIPIKIFAAVEGQPIEANTVIKLNLSLDITLALFTVFIAFVAGVGAIVYRAAIITPRQKRASRKDLKTKGKERKQIENRFSARKSKLRRRP